MTFKFIYQEDGNVDEDDVLERTEATPPREPKPMNFFKKFIELQMLMLHHNAGLTASHPYASDPINWPFVISGISFWTSSTDQRQIYMVGNLLGWWTCTLAMSVFIGMMGAVILARRRGVEAIPEGKFSKRRRIPTLTLMLFQP